MLPCKGSQSKTSARMSHWTWRVVGHQVPKDSQMLSETNWAWSSESCKKKSWNKPKLRRDTAQEAARSHLVSKLWPRVDRFPEVLSQRGARRTPASRQRIVVGPIGGHLVDAVVARGPDTSLVIVSNEAWPQPVALSNESMEASSWESNHWNTKDWQTNRVLNFGSRKNSLASSSCNQWSVFAWRST